MFAKLILKLKNNEQFGFEISSLLQGVLMESIAEDYAELLHESALNMYSQHFERRESDSYWCICTMTKDAKEQIIEKLRGIDTVALKYKETELPVIGRSYEETAYSSFLESTYFGNCPRKIKLDFITPASFKVDGKYQFYPTVEHIFKSLISKHDALDGRTEIYSDDFIKQVNENVHITSYRLRSVSFPLEGIKIPGFMGSITITVSGPQQFVNLVNMLCLFGEYSGIGIKTGIGMGAVKVQQIHRKEK